MAAILGDLISITDFQSFLGQQVLNIYYYRITNVTGLSDAGYEDMLEWFRDTIVAVIRPAQSQNLEHDILELRNLSNGLDIRQLPLNLAGTDADTTSGDAPSYVSLGFQLVRESLVTRNGYKRIGGLRKIRISGNNYVPPSGAVQTNIEDTLGDDWIYGAVTTAEPVIPKRPIPSPAGTAYDYSSISHAIFKVLGTQNTRKVGRGD